MSIKNDDQNIISEFEAAVLVGMSPQLLRWLTSYAPKHNSNKKLSYVKKDKGVLFFEKDEILSYDAWLKLPWPHSYKQTRPTIPSEIRDEIKREASSECAICHSFRDSCEAAHIDPVSDSKNNHPGNLIWLCSNHHTPYDKGFFGPKQKSKDEIQSFKIVLLSYQRTLWGVQAASMEREFFILNELRLIADQIAKSNTPKQKEFVEEIAIKILTELKNLNTEKDKKKKKSKTPKEFSSSKNFIALNTDEATSQNLTEKLKYAEAARKEYVAAKGFVACPLCEATGIHLGDDCPICLGDREINESLSKKVDLEDYEEVDCPLCEGVGNHEGDTCPECNGNSNMQRRFANQIDLRLYKKVKCPLCEGEGSYEGETCPECNGDRKMERKYADQIDLGQYKKVKCPLCEGLGNYEGDTCPECNGDRKMERKFADQIDLGQYKKVPCPSCKGRGSLRGEVCNFCDGNKKIARRYAEQFDLS